MTSSLWIRSHNPAAAPVRFPQDRCVSSVPFQDEIQQKNWAKIGLEMVNEDITVSTPAVRWSFHIKKLSDHLLDQFISIKPLQGQPPIYVHQTPQCPVSSVCVLTLIIKVKLQINLF